MKHIIFAFAALAMSLTLNAQNGVTFSTSSEATALNYNGAWSAADHTTETLDILDWGATKANSLSVEGHQIVGSPFKSYLGGVRLTPDISAILKPTNISPDQFGVYLQGAGGVATLPTGSQVTFLAGGGANYRLTANLAWTTVDAHYLRVGSVNAWEMSTGLAYFFNPQATQSVSLKRFLARRKLIDLAKHQ